MNVFIRLVSITAITFALTLSHASAEWKGGVAKVNITPPQWMPMAGYAGRGDEHAKSKLTDLWAKALVLEDDNGHQAVLVTLDLVGIDRPLSQQICARIQKNHKLSREQISLATSHTHTGPVVASNLRPLHYLLLNEANQKLVDQYAVFLADSIVNVVKEAYQDLKSATFSWGSGEAKFAVNRRNNKEADVPKLRAAGELKGPYDHDVPVLTMKRDEAIKAVVFGYACHSTTLGTFEWSGDYGGFAQMELEKEFPTAIAMFWAGCGGDQNPLPRRTVELARKYGRDLADAVVATVNTEMKPLQGELQTRYEEVDLALATLPTKEELISQTKASNKYTVALARDLLAKLSAGEEMSQTYPYPVQLWRLGREVTWVFQGGEVVVDYAIRIKAELGDSSQNHVNIWCAGYANDVMAYIPSRRVLLEGGYEGGGSMVYYGIPTVWAPEVEETILSSVHRLFQSTQ